MSHTKEEVFTQIKHELQSAALNRIDNGNLYVFMKEAKSAKDNYNLLIFDGGKMRKSTYNFIEKSGDYFINIEDTEYEIQVPEAVSDEEPFMLTIKSPSGALVQFENYI
jgi:hypothetical protein